MNIFKFKKNKTVSEVKEIFTNNPNSVSDNIIDVFKYFLASKKVQEFGKKKRKGISIVNILLTLLLLGFEEVKSVRALILSGLYKITEGEKDVYYRFKNNPKINWRNLLYSINKRFLYLVKKYGSLDDSSKNKIKAFIIDDTVIRKSGERIEHIGKVFEHTINKFVLGYKMLQLAFWEGTSLLPLDFSFHSERGKNKKRPFGLTLKKLRKRYSKKREVNTDGHKRELELFKSKIENMIYMLKRAIKNGYYANYVLVDKWFFCEKLINAVRKLKRGSIHIISAVKMDKRKYLYNGKEYTAKELIRKFRKNFKRSRYLHSHYIKVVVIYKGHKLSLFFNRSFHNKNWQLIATTDTQLSFSKLMMIYSIRWTIEVYFRDMKQYLGLGKSQSQDFDAQIADTTISMIRYVMLSYVKRFQYYETIGGVFLRMKKFIVEYNVAEKIWFILCEVIKSIAELFEISLNEIMKKLFENPIFENTIFMLVSKNYIGNELINNT